MPLLESAGIDVSYVRRFEKLAGGVASEVWLIETMPVRGNSHSTSYRTDGNRYCLKRALSKLNVKQDWRVGVERSQSEVLWFQTVAKLFSNENEFVVPKVLAHDEDCHAFVMTFYDADKYPLWKRQLIDNEVKSETASKIARIMGKIHQSTARLPELAERFNKHEVFDQIRVEPYFIATSKMHPVFADRIRELARNLSQARIALVHGDISPKNILVGHETPIILDAECAIYADPAFDLAFLLNHILLKAFIVDVTFHYKLQESFQNIIKNYLPYVDWEEVSTFENRVLDFLGVFLLARIDGKSPVEYIHNETDKSFVRTFGGSLLMKEINSLTNVSKSFFNKLSKR
jgi:aminoglycoside phosphotransferase (APT) family kinase protein